MTDERALRREAYRLNYRLRSTFFYRRLKEYETASLPARINDLFPYGNLYDWSKYADWDISQDAYQYIASTNINPLQIFCHPKVIREYPQLIAYYRNVAALSQKSVSYLIGINAAKYEGVKAEPVIPTDADAWKLAALFNEHISLIIESSVLSFGEEDIVGLLYASTGAQIDGSWRNAIGEEAEKVVQRLLVKEAVQRGIVTAFLTRDKSTPIPFDVQTADAILGEINRYRGVMLNNQTSILFASEPDLELIAQNGATIAVIEVKGGADPAGALERYGAAIKSFVKTRTTSPTSQTILVVNSITSEMRRRLETDANVSRFFDLTNLIGDPTVLDEFSSLVFSLLLSSNR